MHPRFALSNQKYVSKEIIKIFLCNILAKWITYLYVCMYWNYGLICWLMDSWSVSACSCFIRRSTGSRPVSSPVCYLQTSGSCSVVPSVPQHGHESMTVIINLCRNTCSVMHSDKECYVFTATLVSLLFGWIRFSTSNIEEHMTTWYGCGVSILVFSSDHKPELLSPEAFTRGHGLNLPCTQQRLTE